MGRVRDANPRECITDGCKNIIKGHAARIYCNECRTAKRKIRNKKYKAENETSARIVVAEKKKKRELTEAEIDRRAIAIDKENRRVEAKLAERAARLPSHLIAARIMRDVCFDYAAMVVRQIACETNIYDLEAK